jgi:pimeloyl-ACP methyl ester carboxylesterase
MATFLLVHGAWHGGWCWEKVARILIQAGHTVLTPDLAGLGADHANRSPDLAQQSVDRLVELVLKASEPVIVVAHSLGGMFAAELSERCPDDVARVIYLAAFLPQDGQSCSSFASLDCGSVPYGVEDDGIAGVTRFRDEWLKLTFFSDCSDDDVEWARARLMPQPLEHFDFRVSLTADRFGRVPRTYIQCSRDHAITPGFQQELVRGTPCERIHVLDSAHSPFFSRVEELAELLLFEKEHTKAMPS